MTATQQRVALFLALVVLVVGGGVWLTRDQNSNREQARKRSQEENLFGCGPAADRTPTAWHTIAITQGNVTHTLTRGAPSESTPTPANWQLTSPVRALADPEAVEALLQASCALKSVGVVPSQNAPMDLALFGLKPPRIQLTLTDATGRSQTLKLGDLSQFDKTLFVSRDADTQVERVEGAFAFQVERDTFAWREKRALPIEADLICAVRVTGQDIKAYEVERTQVGQYRLYVPQRPSAPVAADASAVHELWQAIAGLRAQDVMVEVPDLSALKRFGLKNPQLTAVVSTDDHHDHTLRFGVLPIGGEDHVFVQVGPPDAPILRLPNVWSLQKLKDGAQALVDMHILHLSNTAVHAVTVRAGQDALTLRRRPAQDNPDEWLLAQSTITPPDRPLDHVAVGRTVDQLLHTRAARIVTRQANAKDLERAGLSTPRATIELLAEADRPLSILWLGHAQNGETFITDDRKNTIYTVFDSALAGFTLEPNTYMAPVSR